MDRADWFLALITFFVASIAIETVSGPTSSTFEGIVFVAAYPVIVGLPVYLLVHAVRSRVGE